MSRRQTLGPRPPKMGGGSVSSGTTARARRTNSRKSMLPRAPSGGAGLHDANRENNGSGGRSAGGGGVAAPSPSRPGARRPSAGRKSMLPNIPSQGGGGVGAGTPSKNRRVSLAPGPTSLSQANADPRDVRDKSYLGSAVRKMVNYLRSNGYPDSSSLSVRQLLGGPSGRDFQNIMTFLMRRVDPTFARTSSPGGRSAARTDEGHIKFEDEITMAFRCLGYPFPISKTGLVAVGSPTHWPTLVAAIDWLVDLLIIKDGEDVLEWGPGEADMSEDELATLAGSTDRVEMQFHSFLRKSMVAFLRDDNDECAELEGRLLDEFQRDCEKVEAYVTGFDGECERMAEEIEGLNAEVDGLAEAHQKQEECAANIEKFLAVIETLREHNAELSDRVDTLTIEKATMEGEMGDLSEKIERLKTTIGSQELNQEDVRRMEREKARTEEQSARQRKVLDGVVAALDETKERLAACHEMLERRAGEYNANAAELELVPKTSRHAGGLDLEVRPDRSRAGQTATSLLGGVDVRGTAVPLVRKLARSYEGEAAERREAIAEVKDRIEAAEGVREEIKEEVETIKHEIALRDEECDSAREKLESDILDKKGKVERLNDKISSLSDPGGVEARLARLDAEAVELEERRRKESETNRLKKKAVVDEVRRAVEAAQEYRERKAARLREMNDYVARKVEEARKLKLLDS